MTRDPGEPRQEPDRFGAARPLARIGYWRLDQRAAALEWSAEVFRIYGYDPARGQPSLATALAAHPPAVRDTIRRGLSETAATRAEVAVAAVLLRRDGARRDVFLRFRAEDAPGMISGIIMDVTATAPDAAAAQPLARPDAPTDAPTGPAERRRLEVDLRAAAAGGELGLIYQPVVRLPGRETVGYEALLRWTHPTRGQVAPEVFIPVAEESRLIVPIGDWVLERACADAAGWPARLAVAVNVSAVQLAEPDFGARLGGILERTGLEPRRLVLEVTETARMDARLDISAGLAGLRARGLRMALDDVGTGYASLGILRRYAFDFLKIDGSFTAGLHEPPTAAIVASLLELGRRLGIRTIAEGVETEAQLARLAAGGCDLVQGHLTGGPVAAAAIARA